ncbi:unnamed protein product [Parajaminaea phylloscopi]
MKLLTIPVATALVAGSLSAAAPAAEKRAGTDTTTVHLAQCSGTPGLFGGGLLYGITGTNQPPQSYYSELKINYQSSGGAQFDPSPGGFATSASSYNFRFSTVVDAFKRIQANRGVLIIKMADLWGADETTNNSFPFPGDNGDWSKYDAFLQQIIADVRKNGMANSYTTQLELWNEPDINFGGRPQAQFNEMWVRGVNTLRKAFPQGGTFLPLVGPSTANNPGSRNGWWDSFLGYVQGHGGTSAQPDVWNWHLEENGVSNDPIPPAQALPGYVQSYGLNTGLGLQNNEYGVRDQQKPSYSAWFFARYERLRINGLRGNWEGGAKLNDLMADLLIKNGDGSYSTNGEYVAHRYYAQEMTAQGLAPCSTTSGKSVDSFAVAGQNNVRALLGSQFYTGTANFAFDGVNKYFGSARSVKASVYRVPHNNGAAVTAGALVSTRSYNVVNNAVTVPINADNGNDAWYVDLHL